MGLLDRFRGSRPSNELRTASAFLLEGDELVYAVGESNYQDALLGVCGARRGNAVAYDCIAVLVPEPSNSYDRNAVMVQVDGNLVAYLSREDAVAYRPAVQAAAASGRVIACNARIAGRGRGGGTLNLGIFLKLPSARQALAGLKRG